MTSSRSLFVLAVAMLAFAVCAYAGGFQLNEHGARAMAQGGAFAARASDASALYFNPAGLGFQKVGSVYAGVTLISPSTSFYGPTQNNSNEKSVNVAKIFTPINFAVTQPIGEQFHVALGVNNPFGLGTEWPDNWAGKFLTTRVDLETFFFTPTVAYRVNDDLSVGVGFNYVAGSVVIERAIATGFGDPRIKLDLKANGVGFNAGVMYKFSPELSAGISYRSQVKVDATGSATFTPAYSVLPGGDAATTITLPATGFVGVAYRPMDNLEVEADVQYIGWSSYKELAIEFKSNGSTSASPKNYRDTYMLRLGGEYTINDIHLRAGYLYDRSPVKTAYVDPMLPDANRNGFSAGIGLDLTKNLSLDVSYLFLKFNERVVVGTIPEINFDGTYHTYVNLFAANFGYSL